MWPISSSVHQRRLIHHSALLWLSCDLLRFIFWTKAYWLLPRWHPLAPGKIAKPSAPTVPISPHSYPLSEPNYSSYCQLVLACLSQTHFAPSVATLMAFWTKNVSFSQSSSEGTSPPKTYPLLTIVWFTYTSSKLKRLFPNTSSGSPANGPIQSFGNRLDSVLAFCEEFSSNTRNLEKIYFSHHTPSMPHLVAVCWSCIFCWFFSSKGLISQSPSLLLRLPQFLLFCSCMYPFFLILACKHALYPRCTGQTLMYPVQTEY